MYVKQFNSAKTSSVRYHPPIASIHQFDSRFANHVFLFPRRPDCCIYGGLSRDFFWGGGNSLEIHSTKTLHVPYSPFPFIPLSPTNSLFYYSLLGKLDLVLQTVSGITKFEVREIRLRASM